MRLLRRTGRRENSPVFMMQLEMRFKRFVGGAPKARRTKKDLQLGYLPYNCIADMEEDLETIQGKAEVSVGLVRKLVSSWLPKEPSIKTQPIITSHTPQLYGTNVAQAQRNAQLKKRLVGHGALPSSTNTASSDDAQKLKLQRRKDLQDEEDDDEERVLHKISSASKTIKKPTSTLSSYLDKTDSKKKKKKKKKAAALHS
ncbi:hypothetical protein DFJ77DRAFT_437058 [Powellomyces hirtus]|nr:hypothetical protein DFJ77DRAFT_437058 [Powellomyces hirtus]